VDACPSLYGGHNWQASGYSPEAQVIIYPLHQVGIPVKPITCSGANRSPVPAQIDHPFR